MRVRINREIDDVRERGLRIVEYQDKQWKCALNYFPGVIQGCRHSAWQIGADGRVRPRPGARITMSDYEGKPRLKIHSGRRTEPASTAELPMAGSPPRLLPPPPPENLTLDGELGRRSVLDCLTRIEARLARLEAALGTNDSVS